MIWENVRNVKLKTYYYVFIKIKKTENGFFSQRKSCVIQKQIQKIYQNRDKIKNYYLKEQKKLKNIMTTVQNKKNNFEKQRTETDSSYILACKLKNRTRSAFKTKCWKKKTTFDFLGCSTSFVGERILQQLYSELTLENYGSIW